jgi:hypothetical protein
MAKPKIYRQPTKKAEMINAAGKRNSRQPLGLGFIDVAGICPIVFMKLTPDYSS